ncbi:MAG: DUF5009 domain-containing protein [Saprospiraceae bacterium]|nr:DUF5009 domain-containing protein [Saprospiraceae bacterium]
MPKGDTSMTVEKDNFLSAKIIAAPETNISQQGSEKAAATHPNRHLSIDFYRGLVVTFMILVNSPGSVQYAYAPLQHAKWFGCTLADVVFPSFLFIVGVASWFSFAKYNRQWSASVGYKILKRVLLIFIVGLLLNKFPVFWKDLDHWRVMGVLQRIALSYGLAAVLVLTLSWRALIPATIGILLLYWGLLNWFVMPGGDPYGQNTNAMFVLDRWIYGVEIDAAEGIDQFLFGEQHHFRGHGFHFDSEGLLGTLPSVATVILGWLSASLLSRFDARKDVLLRSLLALGVFCGFVGLAWGMVFPISKKLWTSSYVLYAGGISIILLAACVWLIDVRKWRKGVTFFLVFGANPLFVFVLSEGILQTLWYIQTSEGNAQDWLFNHSFRHIDNGKFGSLLFAMSFTFCCWLVCRWLYVRRIFIKL